MGSAHHHDGHHHHHGHAHGHSHAPAATGRLFGVAIGLNLAIVVGQVIFGYLANSVALLADAGHNLSDVLGLVVAFAATRLAARPATARFTYGFGGSSILAALFNASFLLLAIGALSWEALRRLVHPEPVAELTVVAVAAAGMVLNGLTAWLFSGHGHDLNLRGAFLHMAADAAVSAGVVVSALLILATGWLWLDPLTSLGINAVILWGTWSLLRESVAMSLGGVPAAVDLGAVRSHLAELPGVSGLHDLHVWPLSTTETALTVHLVIPAGHPGDGFLTETCRSLSERFAIGHATIQIETGLEACNLVGSHGVQA